MPRVIYVCTNCKNTTIEPLQRGNGAVEIVLWFCYLIPGLLYSVWRRSVPANVCPVCRKDSLVPETMVIENKAEHNSVIVHNERDEVDCPFCAEKILRKAVICKHCGKDLPEEFIKNNKSLFEQEKREIDSRHVEINYDVCLLSVDSVENVFKIIQKVSGLSEQESMFLIENVPSWLVLGVSKDKANSIKSLLEKQGSTVEIKESL